MKLKRLLASILAGAMVFSTMSFTVFADSTYVAKVGNVECADANAMLNALNTASGEVTVEIYGKLETSGFGIKNSDIDKLQFAGMTDDAEICVDGVSYIDVRSTQYPVEYTDLTLSHTNGAYGNDGRLQEYFSTYNGSDVTYTKCTFPNGVTALGSTTGTTVTFNQCVFNNLTSGKYSLWVDGNGTEVVVNGGEFCGVRGAKLFAENGAVFSKLEVNDATFSDTITEKAAVVLTRGEEVVLKNNTFNNTTAKVQVDDDYAPEISGKTVIIDDAEYIVDSDKLDLEEVTPAPVEVSTYEELVAALEKDNANIIMTADITATATQSSGYGVAGIVLNAGDVLDGNCHKITINGANTTWDCAVAMRGGTVKNLTISGAMRGVFMPGANGDVVIDTCVLDDVVYTFNSDAGNKDYSVTIKNTTLNGWTSFSNAHKSVTFENCTFGEGNGYAYCRPYNDTTFTGCEFNEGFEIDAKRTSTPLEFSNCTYDGVALTAENGNVLFFKGGTVVIDSAAVEFEEIALPTATVTSIENDDLTFALNFKADEASKAQLSYYGDWYADFVLTINKDVTFNANGGADGYLSGQYDTWSENWVNVPFEDVTVKAGEPLKIMEYAAKLMGQSGLKLTYNDVYNSVEDFDCGVFFKEEFLQENPDLEVTLELRMYNNEDENESYVIGETYSFKVEEPAEDINVLTRVKYYADYMPVSFYPENIVLYRLGLYAAAESDSYDEYGFEVTVEGQDPVLIKAEKYSSALNIVVEDGVDKFVASDFNTNGGNNVCIFGQTIAFKDDALGDGKIIYRPYVKKDGNVYFGTAYTAPNIYKNK